MHFFIKKVRCSGCGNLREYDGKGLGVTHHPGTNYKLLLACSAVCAQRVRKNNPAKHKKDEAEPDMLMTKRGPIPYRAITKTLPTD